MENKKRNLTFAQQSILARVASKQQVKDSAFQDHIVHSDYADADYSNNVYYDYGDCHGDCYDFGYGTSLSHKFVASQKKSNIFQRVFGRQRG